MSAVIDDVLWSALGDPIRRQILDLLLSNGVGTASSLSERLPLSRQGVAKHLDVLDGAGLVSAVTSGRERQYRLEQAQFARAVAQLTTVGRTWDARMNRIKRLAEAIQQQRGQ